MALLLIQTTCGKPRPIETSGIDDDKHTSQNQNPTIMFGRLIKPMAIGIREYRASAPKMFNQRRLLATVDGNTQRPMPVSRSKATMASRDRATLTIRVCHQEPVPNPVAERLFRVARFSTERHLVPGLTFPAKRCSPRRWLDTPSR